MTDLNEFRIDIPEADLDEAAERDHRNIVSWHTYDRGGHYASRMATDLLVDDVRGFFGALG